MNSTCPPVIMHHVCAKCQTCIISSFSHHGRLNFYHRLHVIMGETEAQSSQTCCARSPRQPGHRQGVPYVLSSPPIDEHLLPWMP